MSNYAIGDIQGCFEELKELLSIISFDEERDRLWLCGDLVNRGFSSLECLLYLHSIKDSCNIVLGNHDLHLIAVHEGEREISKNDTFNDVLSYKYVDKLIDWLKTLPFHMYKKINTKEGEIEYFMTHAGIPPHWTKDDLIRNSEELSKNLSGKESSFFLRTIFGNNPKHPDECNTSEDNLRINVNFLTRMRFLEQDGSHNMNYKGKIEGAPKNLRPWFKGKQHIMKGNTHILFGHWAALDGVTNKSRITALDTGCSWGKRLTAMRLEDQQIFSCDKLK